MVPVSSQYVAEEVFTNKGDIGGSVSGTSPDFLASLGNIIIWNMEKLNKIFLMKRDRALEIMWYADSIYDEIWFCNFDWVQLKMTKKEWMIIAPYFDKNNYRSEEVLNNLKYNHLLHKESLFK